MANLKEVAEMDKTKVESRKKERYEKLKVVIYRNTTKPKTTYQKEFTNRSLASFTNRSWWNGLAMAYANLCRMSYCLIFFFFFF
jgi:hypothetical protein